MEDKTKPWIAGCGCGCIVALLSAITVLGLSLLASYLLWEVGEVRSSFGNGQVTLVWGSILGILSGGALGGIVLLVVRSYASKRLERARP